MSEIDVLVIGAGPAGSALATLAAAAGLRVALVERERFPRDKVCGEFVSPEGVAVLQRLGALDRILAHGPARMDSCLFSDRRGRSIESALPEVPSAGREAIGISRAAMDAALVEVAAQRGVDVLERTEFVAPLFSDGRVMGTRLRSAGSADEGRAVRARLVVAADGRRSMLQRALAPAAGDPMRTGPKSWFGFKIHLDGKQAELGRRIELHLFDGGYVGLGTIEGDRMNLCFLASVAALRACGGSPERLLSERLCRNPLMRDRLEGSRAAGEWKSVGPLRFGIRRPSLGGAMLLGDAAGTIDPFAGEGMSNALTGAELALPWVLAAANNGLTDELAAGWDRTFRRAFTKVTRRARILGRLFEHPHFGEPALTLLNALGAKRILPRIVAGTRTGVPPASPAVRVS